MKLTLRIGTLELAGIRQSQLPAVMERLESTLLARYQGPPASIRLDALPPLRLPQGASPHAVADALAHALLSGPLAARGADE
jgi:hypothetical protein